MSQNSETGTRPLTHNMHSEITLALGELSWAIKWFTWILKKGRFLSKYSIINIAYENMCMSKTYWFVKSVPSKTQNLGRLLLLLLSRFSRVQLCDPISFSKEDRV